MQIPKELTNDILASVAKNVMNKLTPQDDTPDDDNSILGLVKSALSPDQDKETGVFGLITNALSDSEGGVTDSLTGILGGLLNQGGGGGGILDAIGDMLGGGKAEPEPEPQQQSSGGLMDILGGLLGGKKEPEPEPQQQSSGGLMDILGGMLGAKKEPEPQKESGLMGMIADAIGGEGVIGDLLEGILSSKGITASNLSGNNAMSDGIKKFLVNMISEYVMGKIKAKLTGQQQSGSNIIGNILDALTPNN